MTNLRPFNINDYFRIKITERGAEAWAKHFTDLGLEPRSLSVLPDGWTRMQAWEVMQIFGPAIVHGLHSPFETEIQIEFKE